MLSDIVGVSGRAVLDALSGGGTDSERLPALVDRRAKAPPERLRAAKPRWRSACTSSQPVSRHEPFAFASVSSGDQTPGSIRTM